MTLNPISMAHRGLTFDSEQVAFRGLIPYLEVVVVDDGPPPFLEGVGLDALIQAHGFPAPRSVLSLPEHELKAQYERAPVIAVTMASPKAIVERTDAPPTAPSAPRAPVATVTRRAPAVVVKPSAKPPAPAPKVGPVATIVKRAPKTSVIKPKKG